MQAHAPRHTPQSFRFPVQRSVRARWLVLAASASSLAVLLVLLHHVIADGAPLRLAAALALLLLWTASVRWAWRHWRDTPSGYLAWTQGSWQWVNQHGAEQAVTIAVTWDAQDHCLLRCRPAHRGDTSATAAAIPPWIWVERCMAPTHWGDLRRALHFRAPEPRVQ